MGSSDRFIPGLVSVTFRKMAPETIVSLAVKAGLRAVEWGGDVHVTHGNVRVAAEVKRLCDDAGLAISAYGSYYRAGVRDATAPSPDFRQVLDTAIGLGAPRIRVWAGNRGSADADQQDRDRVVDDLGELCRAAAVAGVSIALEYHERTLTDTPDSALSLCERVGAANLFCNWQPRVGVPVSVHLSDIATLRPRLGDVHVFHVRPDRSRVPLADGVADWRDCLTAIAARDARVRFASLEFVKDDDPEQLVRDARALQEIIRRVSKGGNGKF